MYVKHTKTSYIRHLIDLGISADEAVLVATELEKKGAFKK